MNELIISMEISEPYFSFIKNGIKKVEGRKISPTWKNLRIGNELVINCKTRPKPPFLVKIKNIRYYYPNSEIEDPLTTYLICEGLNQVLPWTKNIHDGRNIYLQWSTQEEINKYGIMAIEIEYIKDLDNL